MVRGTMDDDARPLDNSDLSEGDVVELTFSDGRRARYEVRGEWDAEDTFAFEDYDDPAAEAVGKFPGLHVSRVWTLDSGMWDEVPNRRATLSLDADSHTGGIVENWTENDDGRQEDRGYEVHSLQNAEIVSVEDRWNEEGTLASSRAKHVRRVVREAIEEDPLVGTTHAESWTIKGADASGAGCLGDDLGVTVYLTESTSYHVTEAFESYLYENLNEDYWFEVERTGVWTFLYDDEHGTHAVR